MAYLTRLLEGKEPSVQSSSVSMQIFDIPLRHPASLIAMSPGAAAMDGFSL